MQSKAQTESVQTLLHHTHNIWQIIINKRAKDGGIAAKRHVGLTDGEPNP